MKGSITHLQTVSRDTEWMKFYLAQKNTNGTFSKNITPLISLKINEVFNLYVRPHCLILLSPNQLSKLGNQKLIICSLTGALCCLGPPPYLWILSTISTWTCMIYHQFMEVRKTHWHEGFLLRVWQRGRKLDPSVVIPCSGWPAGIIGGAPCSPGLMKDIIFQTGIKEITVSLNFNNNSVVWDIIAAFFQN